MHVIPGSRNRKRRTKAIRTKIGSRIKRSRRGIKS
jgi:hypothetical protein